MNLEVAKIVIAYGALAGLSVGVAYAVWSGVRLGLLLLAAILTRRIVEREQARVVAILQAVKEEAERVQEKKE